MRILLVNKFHYLKGGSEKYYFELAEMLKEHGHEIAFFSMKNEKNIKTKNKEYLTEEINLNGGNKLKAFNIICSKDNERLMEKALNEFKPDIVHINNFQRQLSASIIKPIEKKKIPIVFTAHDLQAVCPNSAMLRNERICEECKNGQYINCMKYQCTKGSKLKSILSVLETRYYRKHKIYEKFDCIISPSSFVGNKIKEELPGIKRIEAIHNYIDLNQYSNCETQDEGYALYSGRISEEKGIINLVKAFQSIQNGVLYIAGDGPEKQKIEKFIKENNLEHRIKLLGYLNSETMKKTLASSKFLVLPSIWYENCPFSIIEALAIGKPVVASNIGGIPELIEDGTNGYLYQYDNIEKLKEALNKMFETNEYFELSKNAKESAKLKFSKDKYYKELIKIYEEVLNKNEQTVK